MLFADQFMYVQIDVGYNWFKQADSLELIAVMHGKNMSYVGMAGCQLEAEGGKAIAELAYATTSLVSLQLFQNYFDDKTVDMLLKLKEQNISLCGLTRHGLGLYRLDHYKHVDFSCCPFRWTLHDCKLLASDYQNISRLRTVCYIATRALISVLKE